MKERVWFALKAVGLLLGPPIMGRLYVAFVCGLFELEPSRGLLVTVAFAASIFGAALFVATIANGLDQ